MVVSKKVVNQIYFHKKHGVSRTDNTQQKDVKSKMTARKLRCGTKLSRGVKAKKRNTKRRKTRAECSSLNMATNVSIHNTEFSNQFISYQPRGLVVRVSDY